MRSLGLCACAVLALAGVPAAGQDTPVAPPTELQVTQSSVVTLDRKRLFEESAMGKAMLARLEEASSDLLAENRKIEAALEAEERQLTERRATLPVDEFRKLAQEFDTKVEELRLAQEVKSRAVTRTRETDQQTFFETAVPVLAEIMEEFGATAIIDRTAVVVSFDRIDITTRAIERLDAVLGDGSGVLTPPEAPAETPQPAP